MVLLLRVVEPPDIVVAIDEKFLHMAATETLVAGEDALPRIGTALELADSTVIGNVAGDDDAVRAAVSEILERLDERVLVARVAEVDVAQDAEADIWFAGKRSRLRVCQPRSREQRKCAHRTEEPAPRKRTGRSRVVFHWRYYTIIRDSKFVARDWKLRWLGFSLPLHCSASNNHNTEYSINLFYIWGQAPRPQVTPPAAKPQIQNMIKVAV